MSAPAPAPAATVGGNIQTFLDKICENVEHLQAILVSDREGVVMLRSPNEFSQDERSEQMITTIFSICSEQTSKLERLGDTQHIISFFSGLIYLQANQLPLVVTMIAAPEVNTGQLLDLLPVISQALGDLRKAIATVVVQD
uniref:Roadblock/LAMTOR2 domain-containing protein n=1 Tax=Chromera velia CCMP2878 TaxID=1169474 RepID=A0A0G4HJ81_9ALVE|mmetsp:Transcript_27661/g.54257  ORF Transcript_27661/g.54257 Transcript_27661/m.54257 type:complete len:141 (-) Transcript_27661:131-553(-)|eukprot:Cvel_1095.t1-p1 / transcript=Cvel_1095.t1 / gene=Cvel_1095 / organism=Chromera_velia_CCMP2878 / gene_product=Ragulator complex protein LAMTOR3-A, putative / transcript_product=Ragulator complex protein LAMTOR3-A, putative / location=Cvel_scaffold35:126051-128513(-) / protein_length=140 / sequence_SO=supercontig / SO=protein_coding / is_pseudo=false